MKYFPLVTITESPNNLKMVIKRLLLYFDAEATEN